MSKLVRLYRKKKRAVAQSLELQGFKPIEYIGDWHFEEDKTDQELIDELKRAHGFNDSNSDWWKFFTQEEFVMHCARLMEDEDERK